jgi:hypothetical protein
MVGNKQTMICNFDVFTLELKKASHNHPKQHHGLQGFDVSSLSAIQILDLVQKQEAYWRWKETRAHQDCQAPVCHLHSLAVVHSLLFTLVPNPNPSFLD